jgi:hypothetical protein
LNIPFQAASFRQLLLSDLGKNTEPASPNRSDDTATVKVVVVSAKASDRS